MVYPNVFYLMPVSFLYYKRRKIFLVKVDANKGILNDVGSIIYFLIFYHH
jgi:hypothetical protein